MAFSQAARRAEGLPPPGVASDRSIEGSVRRAPERDREGDLRLTVAEGGRRIALRNLVASGCDVVATRQRYPDLIISGGIDKRVLSQGKPALDRMLERILPFMRERGGYTPTCDHGVPLEVSYENYMHYRRRCVELGG